MILMDGSAEQNAIGRECGACTACCTLLAVRELNKPMRWACDHVCCAGCRTYETRPQSCRDFHCLWLRGSVGADDALRPDRCGVMFDSFYEMPRNRLRYVAFELWNGAFDGPVVSALLKEVAKAREVELSYRDGSWRTIGPEATQASRRA